MDKEIKYPQFSPSEVNNLGLFLESLKQEQGNPVFKGLSEDSKAFIRGFVERGEEFDDIRKYSLYDDINRLVNNYGFYKQLVTYYGKENLE
jgi:hypothetical protein